ncbi:NAD(P)/FAD-dependent oxidoreductase [Acidisoma cladoniae]|jgi:protoporphyrinogen oxidase|uniref:NAD(P)/FAD-dependent oxidoreductase n=1 Tax=Acidisoma cladoniae TaxID=3040935 RepID=UPI00254AC3E8|nr:NAD(P)/FAD-dependent oxidoreductase [Acidisoma sp. PAMC 29798]
MSDVAVIGAGAMGLAAAYHLLRAGHRVEVFEADDRAGGMAAHFDLDGLSIERFYHFICKADQPTFDLMAELGIADALRWRPTSMGYFFEGSLHPWGDPISLLRFPHLDLLSKIRYGLHMFTSTKRRDWSKLDRLHADDWVRAWGGERVWTVLWEKLFTLKFFEESHDVSAAWLWTRIKRVGTSRSSIFQEELGYIEGGSETLIHCLVERIKAMGGRIHLSTPVQQVATANGAVTGLMVAGALHPFKAVISTAPLILLPRLVPDLPEDVKAQYAALRNIGVACVVHKLRRAVGRDFWVNTNDPRIVVPGLVEFSNLRPLGQDHVVYAPYYMPITNPKWDWSDEALIAESFGYLKLINPAITDADRIASSVARLRHAQPVCPPGFTLPAVETAIRGLQVADTSTYYPEDRGISESVRVAKEMAARVV